MRHLLVLCYAILAIGCDQPAPGNVPPAVVEALTEALHREDLLSIQAAVSEARRFLGTRAGVPETPDEHRFVSDKARLLDPTEAQSAFVPYLRKAESARWWKIGTDPTQLSSPLREVASMVVAGVAAHRAGLTDGDRGLVFAQEAADFLRWAQAEAGVGLFPFPAARRTSKARAMQVGTRFLDDAEKHGRLEEVVNQGWAVNDLGDGGLQFDNGLCGIAMLELYGVTGDRKYLESAHSAARWAASQPLSLNWNYNAFSVELLAHAALVSNEASYRDAALRKARLGVMPGQLPDGKLAGRWLDPHNARPAYHYIMMRALTRLAAALPKDHPERQHVVRVLELGLKARNTEIVERGVMNKEAAIEALLLVTDAFHDDEPFLAETRTKEALEILLRLVSDEYRSGKMPLAPGTWGQVLERFVRKKES